MGAAMVTADAFNGVDIGKDEGVISAGVIIIARQAYKIAYLLTSGVVSEVSKGNFGVIRCRGG